MNSSRSIQVAVGDIAESMTVKVCPYCDSNQTSEFLLAPDRFHGREQIYELTQCGACSGVWTANPPKPSDMGFHYGGAYHQTITRGGEEQSLQRWKKHREVILHHKSSGALLDVGCSSGSFLSAMNNGSWRLYGIEMDEATAQRARENANGEIFVGDVMQAPYEEGTFDVITCHDLVEHVYNPREVLSQLHRWLKPGGILHVVVPNIASWESQLFGSYWYGLELPRHLTHFSPQSLTAIMASVGLRDLYVQTRTVSYIEPSVDYLFTRAGQMLNLNPPAPCDQPEPSFAYKAVRKLVRITLVRPFAYLASQIGRGSSIQAVFTK